MERPWWLWSVNSGFLHCDCSAAFPGLMVTDEVAQAEDRRGPGTGVLTRWALHGQAEADGVRPRHLSACGRCRVAQLGPASAGLAGWKREETGSACRAHSPVGHGRRSLLFPDSFFRPGGRAPWLDRFCVAGFP